MGTADNCMLESCVREGGVTQLTTYSDGSANKIYDELKPPEANGLHRLFHRVRFGVLLSIPRRVVSVLHVLVHMHGTDTDVVIFHTAVLHAQVACCQTNTFSGTRYLVSNLCTRYLVNNLWYTLRGQ